MNRIILTVLMMAICAHASFPDEVEVVLFEEAVDSLPAELTEFKHVLGPSFIRAIKVVLNDCKSRLKQLDASYEPTMDEMRKKYDDAMKLYEEEINVHPVEAQQLQDTEMRQMRNFVEGANRAKEQERKRIKEQCELKKQDVLRSRMFSVMSLFKRIYEANPNSLRLITDQLENFISKLDEGLKECRKMVNSLQVDDAAPLCDDRAIAEAIEFIKTVLLTLPSQVHKGFPDLPGDTEGEIPIDDGSSPDIFVDEIPNILMPGPVIVDEPPEDDDDIFASGASGTGIIIVDESGSGELPTTPVVTTDTPMTAKPTESSVTAESVATTDSTTATTDSTTATTDSTTATTDPTATTNSVTSTISEETTDSIATTDPVTITDTMATTHPVTTSDSMMTTSDSMVTTDAVPAATTDGATEGDSKPNDKTSETDNDFDDHGDDVAIVEDATALPVAVDNIALAQQLDTNPTAKETADDDESNDNGLLPLYIALLVCISLLVTVMIIMIIVVLILRHKAMQGSHESAMSEDDKLSLMKEGYVNPTYQFFDKSSSAH